MCTHTHTHTHMCTHTHTHTHLLFEISSVFFVNQNQVEIVLHAKLLIHILQSRGEVVATQEQSDGNSLSYKNNALRLNHAPNYIKTTPTFNRSPVHDLIFGNSLVLGRDAWGTNWMGRKRWGRKGGIESRTH